MLFRSERVWARAQYWSMVALPAGRLPVTAEPQQYAASVAALERINPQAAQTAYASALQVWPDDRAALAGAGNTAYALGQPEAAATAYGRAVGRHPDFADAWNNLAQVLLDLGRQREASQAIARAVALGGARLPRYQDLQRKIDNK